MSTLSIREIQSTSGSSLIGSWSGRVVSSSIIRNGTRTSMPASAEFIAFNGNFTKLRSDTDLIATCTVYGHFRVSGNCGVGMVIDRAYWDHGCGYQYDVGWTDGSQTIIVTGSSRWTGIPSGTRNIGFGWKTFNRASGDRPFSFLNPFNNPDPRNQQFISSIFVFEILQ